MTTETYTDHQGNIVCADHCDASRMNADGTCRECQDDAHEAELMARFAK